ncbi:MAG TPA: aldo/keto reductase [Candidatus Latescibacteria bacterium]|nr:aldo/keto reductase [Candidatus Latescibacterota bacterium]HJP30225.1 aldo/keto reductase [Candidatus Latescibacterota bacterium]
MLGKAASEIGRDQVVLSTKMAVAGSMPGEPVQFMKPEEVGPALDESLQRLQTDYIDVMLMAVADVPEAFATVVDDIIPEFLRLKEQGKIRFLGSSEQTRSDGAHIWLRHVLPTDQVDVAMVGHNMLNQSAARTVLPLCRERGIGAINVFTVRNLFWNVPRLTEVLTDLTNRGVITQDTMADESPLSWLLEEGECDCLVEAAYRYAAHTEGISLVMCGTIVKSQLEDDIAYIEKGPLPAAALERLRETFGHIDEVMGN